MSAGRADWLGGDAACVGLAGLTVFRDAGDRFSRAARSLGMVVNFDNAATWANDPGGPPWAPTANLMVRRVWPGGNDDDVEAPLAAVAAPEKKKSDEKNESLRVTFVDLAVDVFGKRALNKPFPPGRAGTWRMAYASDAIRVLYTNQGNVFVLTRSER